MTVPRKRDSEPAGGETENKSIAIEVTQGGMTEQAVNCSGERSSISTRFSGQLSRCRCR